MRPERSNLQRRDRMLQIVDWAGRRGKMKNKINFAGHKNIVRYVLPDKTEIRIAGQMRHIIRGSGDEIVNRDDAKSFSQQTVTEVGTQKSRTPSHYCGLF